MLNWLIFSLNIFLHIYVKAILSAVVCVWTRTIDESYDGQMFPFCSSFTQQIKLYFTQQCVTMQFTFRSPHINGRFKQWVTIKLHFLIIILAILQQQNIIQWHIQVMHSIDIFCQRNITKILLKIVFLFFRTVLPLDRTNDGYRTTWQLTWAGRSELNAQLIWPPSLSPHMESLTPLFSLVWVSGSSDQMLQLAHLWPSDHGIYHTTASSKCA